MTVSVLLLTRNRPNYLPKALESVAFQTYRNWSLLLSDNSTDETTARTCEALLADFQRQQAEAPVRYARRSGQLTLGEHLSIATQEIETPFVAIHNDDDIWLPHHLEEAVGWLAQHPNHGLTTSNAIVIDAQGEKLSDSLNTIGTPPTTVGRWMRLWLSSYYGNFPGLVLRTEILKSFVEEVIYKFPEVVNSQVHDVAIPAWALLNGYQMQGFKASSYYYRVHDRSATALGGSLLKERHRLRLWFAKHHFARMTMKCPVFPLLALKSAVALRSPLPTAKPASRGQADSSR